MSGTAISQPFTGTVVRAAKSGAEAVGLPDSPSTTLAAGSR